MLKPDDFVPVQLFKGKLGREIGEHVGDTPLVVLTKDHAELSIFPAEVQRLHFDKSPLAPRRG